MAGEAHPVPFRTRKLSPRAPMVLRSSPWESRTSLTNKGHFLVEGPREGPSICWPPSRRVFTLSSSAPQFQCFSTRRPSLFVPTRQIMTLFSSDFPLSPIARPDLRRKVEIFSFTTDTVFVGSSPSLSVSPRMGMQLWAHIQPKSARLSCPRR